MGKRQSGWASRNRDTQAGLLINRNPAHVLTAEEAGCVKEAYSKKKAKLAREKMRAKGADGDLEPYRCHFCKLWHLGHPTDEDRARKRGENLPREAKGRKVLDGTP